MNSLYDFVIVTKDGAVVNRLTGVTERAFSVYLNKAGDAKFVLQPTDPTVSGNDLLLGNKDLRIYRGGTLVWGGELVYVRTDLSTDSERLEVSAKGYLDLLSKRVIGTAADPVSYADQDLAGIARDLVATYAGDWFAIGTEPTSRTADRTDMQYKNLKEAIDELGNDHIEDGIDYEITADKVFNTYYPQKGRQLAEVVFEWGVNIDYVFVIDDATQMANEAIVLGAGDGTAMVTATRDSVASVQDVYGLRQAVLSYKDVTEQATLESHGDAELAAYQFPTRIVGVRTKGNLDPAFGSYSVGDFVRVKIDRGLIQLDGYYRIYGIDVQITDNDEETITLTFNPN